MDSQYASNNELKPSDLHGILRYVKSFRGETFIIGIEKSLTNHENLKNLHREIDVLRSLNIKIILFYYHLDKGIFSIQAANSFFENLDHLEEFHVFDLHTKSENDLTNVIAEIKTISEHTNLCLLNRPSDSSVLSSADVFKFLFESIEAQKLIFLVDKACPILDGEPLTNISALELNSTLSSKKSSEFPEWFKHHSKIAIQAIDSKIERVHLLNGNRHNALLNELFDKVGIGTMIHSNKYETIREATLSDVQALYHLTQNSVKRETLLKRSIEDIQSNIAHYLVYEIDGSIVACTCIDFFEPEESVEIGSVFVQPYYNGRGIGSKLVQKACEKSQLNGFKYAFIITSNAKSYFINKCGFFESKLEELPIQRRIKFENNKRDSSILKKVF